MPQRESAPTGAPCWIEIFTSDTDKIRTFYGELFGWTSEEAGEEYGGYINLLKDGLPVAGCMRNDGASGMPDLWSVYLTTEDAEKTAASAVDHGGQVMVPAMKVMELGSMAVLIDAGGAAIGAWQPGLHKGFSVLAEPGAPAWFELQTRDYEASVQFYRDVFGWNTSVASDTAEFRYTTLDGDEEPLAGIMDASAFLPDGVPPSWSVYFAVEDTDKALARVGELGGSMISPPEDTPHGRLATAADPTGAVFRLVAGA